MPGGETSGAKGAREGWLKINAILRRFVEGRAGGCCEYCLIHRDFAVTTHEVDHVRSVKHRGRSTKNNLAYACFDCNRHKGSDLGSIDRDGDFYLFFNPRRDTWSDHFRIVGPRIEGRTPTGEVTVRILRMNAPERVRERQILQGMDAYPNG